MLNPDTESEDARDIRAYQAALARQGGGDPVVRDALAAAGIYWLRAVPPNETRLLKELAPEAFAQIPLLCAFQAGKIGCFQMSGGPAATLIYFACLRLENFLPFQDRAPGALEIAALNWWTDRAPDWVIPLTVRIIQHVFGYAYVRGFDEAAGDGFGGDEEYGRLSAQWDCANSGNVA